MIPERITDCHYSLKTERDPGSPSHAAQIATATALEAILWQQHVLAQVLQPPHRRPAAFDGPAGLVPRLRDPISLKNLLDLVAVRLAGLNAKNRPKSTFSIGMMFSIISEFTVL